ncbi:rho guanine nucleotide exchange factor 5-like isoform X3 [Eriocheir sinensis]|uniref:rho guanine nucleotide exchange factor 5-like isoform X3 n=1 Tax=Eriocheir sinensis TaxID=95602 RepID=UPI0021C7298A|nr:rho guanine nucleotide exchange factor 5-like isoform X3 [Eriocheir sinensis]
MVMNTFRSKLRRRRDELFRRGSDESDEWQFVPFNPSVYPANNNNSHTLNNNGTTSPGEPSAPPLPKPALRPWALQRASWHEGHPPVPPHGHGSVAKSYFPLPPCPDPSPPPLPPHGHGYPMYPGSVPPWYGAQFHVSGLNYPASVPPGQARPSPVVLRRATRAPPPPAEEPSSERGSSRPNSGGPTATSGGSRPNSGGPTASSGGSRPNSGGPTASSGGSRPNSGGPTASSGGSRPNSGGPTASSGGSRPNSGGPTASSGGSRPNSAGPIASSGGPTTSVGSFRSNSVGAAPATTVPRSSSGGPGPLATGSRPNSGGPPPSGGSHRPTSGGLAPSTTGSRPAGVRGHSRPNSIASMEGLGSIVAPPRVPPRPNSGCSDVVDGLALSPEGPAPEVPPHGRPKVPPHLISPRNNIPGATLPPPPTVPLPPPPVPAHAPTKPTHLNLEHLTPYLASLLPGGEAQQQQDEESPQSPEYKLPVDQVHEYRSPCSSPEADPGEKGSGVGSGGAGGGGREQRRSDPGGVAALANHASCPAATTSPASTNHALSTAHPGLASSLAAGDLPNNGSEAHEEYGSPDPSSPGLGPPDPSPPVKHHKKKEGQVNRSESLKEKQPRRKRTRENRKHSDPNIPTSKSGDVDADSSLIPDNSGSSSNSSLSPSLESPSHSLEHVSRDAPLPAPVLLNDSDIESEADLPNWQKLVPIEEIKKLKPKDRKRQDTINELFHTERTHVRVLKVLKHLFQVPMSEAGLLSKQNLDLLFPNLDEMLEIHVTFNQAMKKRRLEEPIVSRVGDVLINMFDGEQGDYFQQQAAEFVRSQFTALENLKQQQKRDQRLSNFLQEQENNPACRRLQLKDMLPAGFQRLSKYPLLIESLLSYTDSTAQPEEYEQLSRALERSKEILAYVNQAVQEAENSQRLHELQRKLDQSSLAKNKHGQSEELKGNLDLTKHKLIYEGLLTWRVAKGQKNIDLLVLLLDEFIVLLQKADDKYILKNHSIIKSMVKDENKLTHSPIIKYGPSMLFRAVATDNCAFFIVTTQSVGAQIYELVTSSPAERKVWFRHIQEAQEAYTARDGRNRRGHQHTPLQDPDDSTPPPSDPLRDVDDGVEVDGGEAADAAAEGAADKTQQGAKSSESSGRTEESPGSTSSAQPPASPETLAKKTAEAGGSSSSVSGPSGPTPSAGRSPASGRRLQEVQIIQIVEGTTLIQPSEVKVSQGVVLSAEPVLTPIELLRRKDLKIRQALEEKQQIIANILNIPYEDFESVVDMAGEPAVGNKEPKELVLAAMFQAKCLQESLNEALNLTEGDIVAARANEGRGASLPLYQAPMAKLMNISTTLSQQLSSLLNLVSERDDERERMRKELVASRERLHLLHMRQNSASSQTVGASTQVPSSTQPTASSPYTSRPSSFVSVASSVADHSDTSLQHDTDEGH